MEKGTFSDESIIEKIQSDFIPVKVKTTNNETFHTPMGDMNTMQLVQALKIRGVPAVFFFDQKGQIVFTIPGYLPAERYTTILDYISGNHYKEESFDDYEKSLKG